MVIEASIEDTLGNPIHTLRRKIITSLEDGLAFFGPEHSVFATDYPFDKEAGMLNLKGTIDVIDSLDCSDADRRQIYELGPRMLLGDSG